MSDDNNRIYVLDGGFGTQISKYCTNYESHPLWTSYLLYKNWEPIIQTHLDYLNAGADIIETNTYQASIPGFQKHINENLTEKECKELIERAVKLAQEAKERYLKETKSTRKILIAGSVGSYGAYLHDGSEYSGNFTKTTTIETIREWHKPRIDTLVNSGVDLLAMETIPAEMEAMMLAELLKSYPNMKAWISFSCKDEHNTNYGEHFQTVAKKVFESNPDQIIGIGINCTKPEYVESLFKGFNDGRKIPIPLLTYPNSGETYDKEKGWIDKENCKPLESYVKTWVQLGVKYIGGCCRTTSDTIRKIRQEVDLLQKQN